MFAEGAKPKIYKLPVNQTARLINEIPGKKVEVFETLNDAKEGVDTGVVRRILACATRLSGGRSFLEIGSDSDPS